MAQFDGSLKVPVEDAHNSTGLLRGDGAGDGRIALRPRLHPRWHRRQQRGSRPRAHRRHRFGRPFSVGPLRNPQEQEGQPAYWSRCSRALPGTDIARHRRKWAFVSPAAAAITRWVCRDPSRPAFRLDPGGRGRPHRDYGAQGGSSLTAAPDGQAKFVGRGRGISSVAGSPASGTVTSGWL
jgi:hypothetical protein